MECGYCEPVCPSRDLTLTPRQRIVVKRAIATAQAGGNTALAAELEKDYEYEGVQASFEALCERAGITVLVPENIDSLCCGAPWSSKR